MRILSVAFSAMTVGTANGGGAEQILWIVERGLVERGHESLVIAAPGSNVAGELIASENHGETIARTLARERVDLIHFHGLDFHEYLPETGTPMLATLHLPVSYYPVWIFERFGLMLNCVSRSQAESTALSRDLPVVTNGVPTELYRPADADEYLLWLGRICPEKGVHFALDAAHYLDLPLTIAGPVHPYREHQEYFANIVEPRLDSKRRYIGAVDVERKRELLAGARCLLVPSLVAETSSLVAMESLSCGTPVVAFRTGALPEVVDDGSTGFLVKDVEQMIDAVCRVPELSRDRCRAVAVHRFDAGRMIDDYIRLYGRIMTRHFGTSSAPHENL
jgi:glycosyltransferase involved in cell wall biosynthesis